MAQKNVIMQDVYAALKYIINLLSRPLWVDPATSRVKTDTILISGTVTTCGTVTTITQLAGFAIQYDIKQSTMYDLSRISWAQNIRARIS